jgi:hypothetical protein
VRSTNPLITELSRSLPVAFPEAGDSEIEISNELIPTVGLSFPIDRLQNPITTAPQNGTRCFSTVFANANTAGGTFLALTLTKGLWRITASITCAANYANIGGGACVSIFLANTAGSNYLVGVVAGGSAAQPSVSEVSQVYEYLLPADGYTLTYSYQANAVGEINHGLIIINAQRLA